MRGFLVACRYLTIVPLPRADDRGDVGRAAVWFPVVGLGLGGILALAAFGAGTATPPAVGAVLVVGLWAGLTGGLHLDGLADALDGLGAGWNPEDALRIMRDARTGAYGVTGIVLVLALKLAALASLSSHLRWRTLMAAPVLGRLAALLLAHRCPPARADGAGHRFAEGIGGPSVAGATGLATLVSLSLLGPWGAVFVMATGAAAVASAAYLRRRLGGQTGDCLGALIEATEGGLLALASALDYLGVL